LLYLAIYLCYVTDIYILLLLLLGLAIYFFYGIRNSVEGFTDDEDAGSTHGEYIVNPETPTPGQKVRPVQPKQSKLKKEDEQHLEDDFQVTPADEVAKEPGKE